MGGWGVLERRFGGLTADEVDAALAAVPGRDATPAPASAAAYLAAQGGPDLDGDPAELGDVYQRRTMTAARSLAAMMAVSVTMEEAATRLGVSRSRLSHRLAEGSLWAVTVAGRRRVPVWQFTDSGRTLPGLVDVVAAVPSGMHPLSIEAFMTTPRADFDGRSPAGWLESGGEAAPVAEWLAAMGHE